MIDPTAFLNTGRPPVQDFILLNGNRSPGKATVTGAGSPRTWDKQKGWGYSGATLTYTGDDLSEFDVIVELWEPEHWREWTSFARLLEKAPTGVRATSLEIVHPQLNRAPLKITQVVIRDVTQFELSNTGSWTARIALMVYRAAKAALGTPKGSIPKAENGIADFSADPELGGLLDKQASLGGIL